MRFNNLIPELSVTNFNKSLDFYTKLLGFIIEYQRKENNFAFLSMEGSQIMIQENNNTWSTGKPIYPLGRGINLQIEVKEVKPIIDRLNDNKYKLFRKVKNNWYRKDNLLLGNKEFLVQDPDGYLLRFSEDLGHKEI